MRWQRGLRINTGTMRLALPVAVVATVAATLVWAQSEQPVEAGTFLFGGGDFQVVRDLKEIEVLPGAMLAVNDTLRTPIGARIRAILSDDSVVMLWEDAEVRLQTVELDVLSGIRTVEVEQITGSLRFVASDFTVAQSTVAIRTPAAIITLAGGADVVVRHNPANDQSEVMVLAGSVEVRHLFSEFPGVVTLEPLQSSVVSMNQAPSSAVFMDRSAYDALQAELNWRMPQPLLDWDARFAAHLDALADRGYGRVRRSVSRPLTPAWGVSEGLIDQAVADRPGSVAPTPRSTLRVEFEFGSSEEGAP